MVSPSKSRGFGGSPDAREEEDHLSALRHALAAGEEAGLLPEDALAEPQAADAVQRLTEVCDELSPEDTRQLLAVFVRAQHMPPSLWRGGLAEHLVGCLEELPDLHVVHVALMVAALELRGPPETLLELTEHLDVRAPTLSPAGLAAATVAISQLGPWRGSLPGGLVIEELSEKVELLNLRELSSSMLAAATLGVDDLAFWQRLHSHLLGNVTELEPQHVADALMAVATTRLLPIALLEALQDQLPRLVSQMSPDVALTCAWALASMQLFPARSFPRLLEQVVPAGGDAPEVSAAQAKQLRQILLSLELESGAAKAAQEVAPALRMRITAAVEEGASASGEDCADEAVAEEIGSLLVEAGADFGLSVDVQDIYTVDVVVQGLPGGAKVGVVLDGVSPETANYPRDPWTSLKLRQLGHMGMTPKWLPVQRWSAWEDEERLDFVKSLVAVR